jgi:hypothetical protein
MLAELQRRNVIRHCARHPREGGDPVEKVVRSTQQGFARYAPVFHWIPACAGMTVIGFPES